MNAEFVSLKEYVDKLFSEHDKRYRERFESLQRALDLAASETDKKNTELNDVRHRFIPRETFDNYRDSQQRRAKAIIITFIAMGLTVVGLIIQIVNK